VLSIFGKLDILVNGAAGNFLSPSELLSTNAFRNVIDIDLVGSFNMCKYAFEALKQSKGVIINISATLHRPAMFWQIHASAAKSGLEAASRSLALEWGEFGIRVNVLSPGPILNTEGWERLTGKQMGMGQSSIEESTINATPLRKLGTIQDIAVTALFLACDNANYISGVVLIVDGAMSLYKTPHVPREVISEIVNSREKKPKSGHCSNCFIFSLR